WSSDVCSSDLTFEVRATIDAEPGAFELGQSARVFLPSTPDGALSVPLAALLPGPDGGHGVFVVASDGTLELRPVQIAGYGGTTVEVTAGLQSGEHGVDWKSTR